MTTRSELTIFRGIVPTPLLVFFCTVSVFAVLGFTIFTKVLIGDIILVVPRDGVDGGDGGQSVSTHFLNAAIVCFAGIVFVLFLYFSIQSIIKRAFLALIRHQARTVSSNKSQ